MQNVSDSGIPVVLQNPIAACCSIISDYFAPNSNSFVLSTHVQRASLSRYVRDFLNQVLLCLSTIKVEIEDIQGNRLPSFYRKFNLIVVDSAESLRQLNPGQLSRDYDIQEHYLLYLIHASRFSNITEVLHEMFSYFWQNYIINVSIIGVNKENQTVDVYTYYPFHSHQLCKMVNVELINTFSGTWLKPLDEYIFPEKVWNLHECPLTVAVWDAPPYLSYGRSDNGIYEIGYFEADMLHVLAEKLNFTFDLKEPPNNEQRGKVLMNGTTTGALRMIQDRTADLSLGSFRYTIERAKLMTAAVPYYQTWQVYGFLRTAQPYTSLEILLFAFDERTWICLCLSIQVALILAYVIQCYYNTTMLARIIMGFPKTPAALINIFRIFMGESLTKLPQTNFTRFVIIFWYVYGLLIRVAYQSLLFQLLKGNLYHNPPQSLEDLIYHGCKLVMTEGTFDSVATVPRIEQGSIDVIKIKNNSEESAFFYVERNKDGHCLANVSPKDFFIYHATKERKRGVFHILPEMIFAQHITMFFSKHSFLINRFNFLFMNLRSMGLIDFWASKSLDVSYFIGQSETLFQPIPLTSLKGVFIIYFALIQGTIMIFCLELAVFKLRTFLHKTRYQYPYIE